MTIAYKGKERIENEEKLKFLISELVKTENFGLFFGSGTSKGLGGLTMSEVWDEFKENHVESYVKLFSDKYLDRSEEYRDKNWLIGQLIDRLSEVIDDSETLGSSNSEIASTILEDLVRALIHAAILSEDLWGQSSEFLLENDKLFHHREVLRKVLGFRTKGQSNIWAFTLNYDLALEWAAKSINLKIKNGFVDGVDNKFRLNVFDPKSYFTDNEKLVSEGPPLLNVVKIHGSLTWTYMNGKVVELLEDEAFQELLDYLVFEGMSRIPELMILPGGSNYVKFTDYPHGMLLQQFERFLNIPGSVLFVVGYGHCDNHINEVIHSAISKNDELKVVVYFPEFTGMEDTSNLPKGLTRIIEMENSNVIIVGGGENAYFDAFCGHLPESG